jgi:hypothetical protein
MALPACHSRRLFDGEESLFFCAHPQLHAKDNLVTPEICRICPYWQQPAPPEFRPFRPDARPKPRGPCLHLGEQTDLRECKTCGGSVRVKVFACAHPDHRETMLRYCAGCSDHQERPREEEAVAEQRTGEGKDAGGRISG